MFDDFDRTEQNRTLDYCDFIKIVLMQLVILHHATIFWSGANWFNIVEPAYESEYLKWFVRLFGGFRMYAFVLIAGYLYAYLKYELGKYQDLKAFLINKAKRLLIPFAFASMVWVIPFNIYYFDMTLREIFKKFVLAYSPAQLWFLMMLFVLFIIVWFTMDKIYQNFWKGLAFSLVLYVLSYVVSITVGNIFQVVSAMRYHLFFWMGVQIWRKEDNFFNKVPSLVYLATYCTIFAVIMWLGTHSSMVYKIVNLGANLVLHIVGALMGFYVLARIARKFDYKGNKLYEFLKERNIVIYLFHQQTIYVVISNLNGKVSAELNALANFVIALLGSMFIAWILGKWKITRMLVGLK